HRNRRPDPRQLSQKPPRTTPPTKPRRLIPRLDSETLIPKLSHSAPIRRATDLAVLDVDHLITVWSAGRRAGARGRGQPSATCVLSRGPNQPYPTNHTRECSDPVPAAGIRPRA